jgi:2-phosphoglycerate kinase
LNLFSRYRTINAMVWDPFGTIGNALWLGGGQWAGKSTVARILAHRLGLTAYHHDYHNARSHYDRRVACWLRAGESTTDPDPDEMWVRHTPQEMAADVLAHFPQQFEWILDDLRALVSGRPIIAEGWGLRPELVAALGGAERMLVMVPTEQFRRHQIRTLERAGRIRAAVSDPDLAQRNRVERDRLIAADAVASAQRHGIPVLRIDGSRDAEGVADIAAGMWPAS